MSTNGRPILTIHNDHSIYRLLLIGMFILSPALYFLCHNEAFNSYDPFYLRGVNSVLCLLTLGLSFISNRPVYKASLYITILSFIVVNNYLLISENSFAPVYTYSSVIVFMGMVFLCKQRREFAVLTVLNTGAVLAAYFTSKNTEISIISLVILLATFTTIAYITFTIRKVYRLKFKKAVDNLTQLNHTLMLNEQKLRESRNQLHAIINSINDIVFEMDENKDCLNVWYNEMLPLHFDPKKMLTHRLRDIIGAEKAEPFNVALDYVIKHRKPTSLEFASVFGTDKWFMAKMTPVFDREGNYTARISVSISDISGQKKYEQALKQNEDLLLEAHAIAKIGNWWYDGDTREYYWSNNLYALLEIDSVPDNTDKFSYYLKLVHPDDLESTKNFFSGKNRSTNGTFEHKFITPEGNLKYIKVIRGEVIYDEAGKFKRISGIIQDITEIRLSEKSARVSQAELIEAQTIAKIGNWNWDVLKGKLTWSDEINNIYDATHKTNSARNFIRVFLHYVHPADKHVLKKLIKSPASVTNTSYEYRIITPKGNVRHLSIIVGKLLTRDGSIRKIIGTIQDITERKKAEIEVKRSENKYKQILESVKLAAVTISEGGNITFCNRYLAGLLGYEQHEIIGLNWIDDFIPDNFKNLLTNWIINKTVRAHFINPVICRNGDQRVMRWQNTVSFDELGNVREITAIGEDVTDQQKATQELISAKEDAERSSRFKSEFLSTMSHEIRTPMNAVIGTTNLLLSEDPKPEQLEYLNTLKFSGENLLAIINDILDYNKIEAGKLELNKAPVNISVQAQKIWRSFQLRAKQKEIELRLVTDDNLPEFVLADKVRLNQILNNLICNAVKFTDKGSVLISIDKVADDGANAKIKFTITDTGIGIAPESLGVIFDPFIQETQLHNYGGTGLGLAITKRLVELHQSRIEVTSEMGKGTRFMFTIDFEITAHSDKPVATPADALLKDLTGLNILVVDDNKMNLFIASKYLRKWHAKVDEALNGQIAIDMMELNNYDLIIMDLQMPVMDGFQATGVIRETNHSIPIIALTADAMPETHSKAFAAGMNDYLTKPFLPETLFEKVSKHTAKPTGHPINGPVDISQN
ncbi:MAG: PAS domain S-box protein [Mucilaginibacter sp.]